jgi:purine-binding chemotaxis protein CheW
MKNDEVQHKDTIQLVTFTVGKEEYGVRIEEVQEIVRMPEITRLPQTESFIKGVINLRGNIIPVIDMRERFNLEKKDYSDMTRVIVVRIEEKLTGLIVDDVAQVLEIGLSEIEEAPEIITGRSKEFIAGIGKINDLMIIIIDTKKILTNSEISAVGKASA